MNKRYVIYVSIFIAFVLEVLPMPIGTDIYRPDWLLLVLVYWNIALPQRVNLGVAFICGILLDVLLGNSLGINSLGLVIVVYITSIHYQRLRNYSVWQQMAVLGLLCALYNVTVFWLHHWLTDVLFQFTYFWPIVTSVFLWPWLFWMLRKIRRQLALK